MEIGNVSSQAIIIVDLDEYGRVCDFNIEIQDQIEVCDKQDPTKTKIGLELNPKTLTKHFSCGGCNAVLNFNMVVRTARARRKNRNKRKAPHTEFIEKELNRIKETQKKDCDDLVEEIVTPPTTEQEEPHKEIPEIVQEEIIIENSSVYQCPLDTCNQLFESMQEWQTHYMSQHHEEKSDQMKMPVSRTMDDSGQLNPEVTDEIELVLETDDTYVFPKCSSCKQPITQLDTLDEMSNLCYFCSFQRHQKVSNPVTYQFFCTSCSTTFETQQKLADHIKIHHPVYRCPVCHTNFVTNKDLADHMRTSCKIRWVSCDICTHIAVSEPELTKHKEKSHNIVS